MNIPVRKVLVIGGGFSGMCAAIELRKRGIDVDLIEIDGGWRAYGAGITARHTPCPLNWGLGASGNTMLRTEDVSPSAPTTRS